MRVEPQKVNGQIENESPGINKTMQTIAIVFVFVAVFYFFIKLLFL